MTTTMPTLEWCEFSAGQVEVLLESLYERNSSGGAVPNEQVLRRVDVYTVAAFQISKYPITNASYQSFIDAPDGRKNKTWWNYDSRALDDRSPRVKKPGILDDDHAPRTNVSWWDAMAFCGWLSSQLGFQVSLPHEAQWLRAVFPTASDEACVIFPVQEIWEWCCAENNSTGAPYRWNNYRRDIHKLDAHQQRGFRIVRVVEGHPAVTRTDSRRVSNPSTAAE